MAILRIGGLPVSGAVRFGGLPLTGASRAAGLGPLPALVPAPSGDIPAPSFYWPFDNGTFDTVQSLLLAFSASVTFLSSPIFGNYIRNAVSGNSADYTEDPIGTAASRIVVAGWMQYSSVITNGNTLSGGSELQLKTAEYAGNLNSLRVILGAGAPVGYMDELAIWLDPPAEWTAEAAYASLYNGGLGVVWRDGQWWEVAE